MTAADKVRRDAQIIAERARGLSWPTIAERHGLSERHCRTVWQAYAHVQLPLDDGDPVETVREAIFQLDAAIEDLALIAENASHDAVRLGAVKSRLAAIDQRLSLLRAVGLLPHDLGLLRREIDYRHVTRVLFEVLGRHGVEVEEDLAAALNDARLVRNGHPGATERFRR